MNPTQPPCDELHNGEPCPNPAQSPFTCCLRCRSALSERLYLEDRARREREEKEEVTP